MGTIAGRMTKSNKIGYIGSFPIPEVVQGINSSFIHARKVNPAVEMKVVWAYTWFDPAKEADAASALLAEGVDVILQHTDSTAPLAQLQQQGKIGFGQASDMAAFKPTPRVSSIIDNWAPYYVKRVGEVLDGTWKSHGVWLGIGDGEVQIGEITEAVPAEVPVLDAPHVHLAIVQQRNKLRGVRRGPCRVPRRRGGKRIGPPRSDSSGGLWSV